MFSPSPQSTGGNNLLKRVGEALPVEAEPSSDDPYGLPAELFSVCLRLSIFLRRFGQEWTPVQRARYSEIHGRLCLWRDNTLDGRLELCLTNSPELYSSILDLLCAIGQVFLKATTGKLPFRVGLAQEIGVARLSQELKQLLEDSTTVLETLSADEPETESESDTVGSESEAEVQGKADYLNGFLRSLNGRTKLLMDTCPALEQTYFHANKPTRALTTALPMFRVSEAAQHYVRKVYDRFAAGDIGLIERLGEANWQRHQRLRSDEDLTAEDRAREEALTLSLFRPASQFRDSALGASLPSSSKFAPSVASHNSFASTVMSGSSGKSRVPKTPVAVSRGEPFECQICYTIVSGLRNRIDWKMHVFEDLQPYICTAADCPDILRTFASRKEWSNHEFSKHRSTTSYRCHSCSEDFVSRNDCLDHYASVHNMTDLEGNQGRLMLAAATTTVVDSIAQQECPLCRETDWPTQRKFVTHVGRHMEEVALSSLPREIDSDDNSTRSDSEGVREAEIIGTSDLIAEEERLPSQRIAELAQGEEIRSGDAWSDNADPDSSRLQDTERRRCPHPDCGRLFKDLEAHMLTHKAELPFKCLIQQCPYHQRGFARAYDFNRHLLCHFKGTMVCGYCPKDDSGSRGNFTRADVFKRHLTAVHGVEQTPPNSRKSAHTVTKTRTLSDYGPGATGRCTNCRQVFGDAQDFYEHLDECTIAVIEQDISQDIDAAHRKVFNDREVQDTLDQHHLETDRSLPSEPEVDDDDNDEEEEGWPYEGDEEIEGGVFSVATNSRRPRKYFPFSWGSNTERRGMKKPRVRRGTQLYSSEKPLEDEFENSRGAIPAQTLHTDLDVETLKRAKALHDAALEDEGFEQPGTPDEVDLDELMK